MTLRKFLIILSIAALAGCATHKQAVQEPVKQPAADTAKKPAFAERPQAPQPPPAPAAPAEQEYTGSKGPVKEVWGWRVQIFVSSTLENARKVAEEARWKFHDQQIFMTDFEPYYKVQVGTNLTRQDADNLRARAKALGYTQAYVVEVQVNH